MWLFGNKKVSHFILEGVSGAAVLVVYGCKWVQPYQIILSSTPLVSNVYLVEKKASVINDLNNNAE